ncbi:hypothetical protein V6N12_019926 [Hibiscus sabdariffa]
MIAPSQFQSADLPVLASSATLPVTEVRHTNGPLQNHVVDQSNVADLVTEVEVTDVQVPDVLVQHEHQPSCVAMPAADASQSVASGDQSIMGDQDEVNVTIPAAHTPQSAASIDEPNLNDQDEIMLRLQELSTALTVAWLGNKVHHVGRELNVVADMLASLSRGEKHYLMLHLLHYSS